MIGFVKGKLSLKSTEYALVEVNGVGYQVFISPKTLWNLPKVGDKIIFYTYTYLRDDSLRLYGFLDKDDKQMFENLLQISGIGPRIALAVHSVFNSNEFEEAILNQDVDLIRTIPGVGKKTALRLILELREKLELPDLTKVVKAKISDKVAKTMKEAKQALRNLGFKPSEINLLLEGFTIKEGEETTVEKIVRYALKNITKR